MDEDAAYAAWKRQLGVGIAQLREARGMSQRRLSLVIELDRVTLNRIESGRANPTVDTLNRIAAGLGLSIGELLATCADVPASRRG